MDLNPLSKTLNQHAFTSGLNDSQTAKLAELAHQVSSKKTRLSWWLGSNPSISIC